MRSKCNMFRSSLMIIAVCAGNIAHSKTSSVEVSDLTLSFRVDETFIPKVYRESLREEWKVFCNSFSKNFIIAKGPQSRGIFNNAECLPIAYNNNRDKLLEQNSWKMIFSWDMEGLTISTYYQPKDIRIEPFLVHTYILPEEITPDLLFTNNEAGLFLVSKIYHMLPAAWSIALDKEDSLFELQPFDNPLFDTTAQRRVLGFFTLNFDSIKRMWVPKLYATAEPIEATADARELDDGNNRALRIRWLRPPPKEKFRLWAQTIHDPKERDPQPAFLNRRDIGPSLLDRYAREKFKTHTATFRYSIPSPRGSTPPGQAPKAEAAVSLGKGRFSGLWAGAEYSSRGSEKLGGRPAYSWGRQEGGWSFMLGDPHSIGHYSSRFRLTPKIGVLNFQAYLPVETNANAASLTYTKFYVKNALEYGGEFAAEFERHNVRGKIWANIYLAGFSLARRPSTNVSSQRVGAEFSANLYKTRGGVGVAALLVGYVDSVAIQDQKETKTSNIPSVENETFNVDYIYTYTGAGISLSW